jgi:hypothetical protein
MRRFKNGQFYGEADLRQHIVGKHRLKPSLSADFGMVLPVNLLPGFLEAVAL